LDLPAAAAQNLKSKHFGKISCRVLPEQQRGGFNDQIPADGVMQPCAAATIANIL
jgi:hypothetical protein